MGFNNIVLIAVSFSFVTLFSSGSSWGSGHEGNGGDVIVCRDTQGGISSVELLDYFESRVLHQIPPALGEGDFERRIENVLRRMMRVSPVRAALYLDWARDFFQDAVLIPNIELADISDSQHVLLPRGCQVLQLAIQKEPQFPGEKRYTISRDLWDKLDEDNKASLVLHELVYREARNAGHINSIPTRFLNAIISSDQMDSISETELIDILVAGKFELGERGGIPYRICDGFVCNPLPLPAGPYYAALVSGLEFTTQGHRLSGRLIRLFPDGKIFRIITDRTVVLKIGELQIPLSKRRFSRSHSFSIEFYPSGAVRRARLDQDMEIPTHSGRMRKVKAGSSAKFTEDGKLE